MSTPAEYTSRLNDDGNATHVLKCVEPFFTEMLLGKKTFEIRKEDRSFKFYPDDSLVLCQIVNGKDTGARLHRKVLYVLRDAVEYGLMDGYVIMAVK